MNYIEALGRLVAAGPQQSGWVWEDRQAAYRIGDQYYDNTVYDANSRGGQRDGLNSTLGNAAAADLAGLYNPVAAVVDLYQHVYAGAFRGPQDDPQRDDPSDIRAESANAVALDALARIWRWSNITIEKQSLCRLPSLHGVAGIRIVARNHPDVAQRRVWLKAEHPGTIRDVELDDRGNVTGAELEYEETRGLGEAAVTYTIREVLTKDVISTYRVDGTQLIPFDLFAWQDGGPMASYVNELGVVPYVLSRHDGAETWGRSAWYRARGPIDRLNALLSHTDVQIHEHVNVTWFVAASGAPPQEFDFSGKKVIYADTRGGGVPTVQPMVANLDLSGARQQAELQIAIIEDMLPELKATQGRYLSGQSGETIAQLRQPARDRLRLAQARYEDALIRAQQIALSWGVLLELWDLGTGTGTREAADRTYREGLEDHTFNDRPLLEDAPVTQQSGGSAPTGAATSAAGQGTQQQDGGQQ